MPTVLLNSFIQSAPSYYGGFNMITIGKYDLKTHYDENGKLMYWIFINTGEGEGEALGVSKEKLESLLDGYWEEEF